MLQIHETWTEVREVGEGSLQAYGLGESGWYEPFTEDLGKLFKSLMKEFGRCVSKIYQDAPDGVDDPVGWVFQKRAKYDDCNQTYLQETWVTHRQVKE